MAKKSDIPTSGNKDKVLKFAQGIVEDAVFGKRLEGIYDKYKRGIAYWDGVHKISTNTDRQGNQVWNKFAEIVVNRISQISSVRPKWIFKPQGGTNDIYTANALNQIIGDVIWEDIEWEDKGEDALLEAAFGGSCHIKTSFRLEDGWPQFDVIPNPMIFPDNKATSARNRRYVVQAIVMNVSDIKDIYGVDVVPDNDLENKNISVNFEEFNLSFEQKSSTSYKMENIWRGSNYNRRGDWLQDNIGNAVIWEIWLEDKTRENIPFDEREVENEHQLILNAKIPEVADEENHAEHVVRHLALLQEMEDSPFKENLALHIKAHDNYRDSEGMFIKTRRKYPRGRVITVCQGKLLKDKENTLPIHWQDVFIKFDWWKRLLSYWGKPLTNDLFDPQDALNHRKNAITKNINSQNKGIVMLRRQLYQSMFGSSNKKKMRGDVESLVIPSDSPTQDLHRDNGPQLPAHVVNDPMIIEDFMERNSGHEGIMAGRYPKGSPPIGAIEQLMSQAQKPIDIVIGHYSFALKKMARNAIAIMNKYMDENTRFRILVDDEASQQKYQMISWKDLSDRNGILDIRVDIVNQMSTSKDSRFQRALMLKQYGVYDNQAVLDADEDPMKFDVMQRNNEIGQLRMLVEAMGKEIEEKKSELKTVYNRLQGSDGSGNTGQKQAEPKKIE